MRSSSEGDSCRYAVSSTKSKSIVDILDKVFDILEDTDDGDHVDYGASSFLGGGEDLLPREQSPQ
jgi:hypothetical protein